MIILFFLGVAEPSLNGEDAVVTLIVAEASRLRTTAKTPSLH
jgi:hypothetical protein